MDSRTNDEIENFVFADDVSDEAWRLRRPLVVFSAPQRPAHPRMSGRPFVLADRFPTHVGSTSSDPA
jgi:hypothetical protein